MGSPRAEPALSTQQAHPGSTFQREVWDMGRPQDNRKYYRTPKGRAATERAQNRLAIRRSQALILAALSGDVEALELLRAALRGEHE